MKIVTLFLNFIPFKIFCQVSPSSTFEVLDGNYSNLQGQEQNGSILTQPKRSSLVETVDRVVWIYEILMWVSELVLQSFWGSTELQNLLFFLLVLWTIKVL